jgi:hypothetical protein
MRKNNAMPGDNRPARWLESELKRQDAKDTKKTGVRSSIFPWICVMTSTCFAKPTSRSTELPCFVVSVASWRFNSLRRHHTDA